MYRISYKLKLTSSLCFLLITLSILVAYNSQTTGYELSIYDSTPEIIWISLFFSILCGICIIFHQVYTKNYINNNFYYFGFISLILSRITLLYIPYIRGYYSWRGDNISQLGLLKNILSTGFISDTNFYPVTHILLTELVNVSGAPAEFFVIHSTALFSCFYVISIFLLATTVLSSRSAQILTFAAIAGVLFNSYDVYLMPNGWSILYIPFVFFLIFRSINSLRLEYKLLLVITLLLYPFFHPLSSIMLLLMFLTIGFSSSLFFHGIGKKYFGKHSRGIIPFPTTASLIVITTLFPWILSFKFFNLHIRNLWMALTGGSSPSAILEMSEKLGKVNIHGLDLITLTIKLMGDELIFLILSTISALILFYKYKKNKPIDNSLVLFLNITFVIGVLYFFYLLNVIPGLGNIGSSRLIAYSVIFTPITVGFTLDYLMSKKTKIVALTCITLIIIASTISILSLYPSPYIINPNPSVTHMDMYGMSWYINYKNETLSDTEILSPTFRFADAILGEKVSIHRMDIKRSVQTIPDHFNYTSHESLGNSYPEDKYSVITMFDKQVYDTVWKTVGRFNKTDFEKLKQDSTVDRLYSNGECDVWYIHRA